VTNDNLNDALEQDAADARKVFTKEHVQHNGQDPEDYLKGKSNKEVVDLWHEFLGQLVQGGVPIVPMLGRNGAQFPSKTLWQEGKARIDVENPNPGQRSGQIHYQEGGKGATQYIYDPVTKAFRGLSETKNSELLSRPEVQKAIEKALRFLGEDQ
jgi:hypothetical protein